MFRVFRLLWAVVCTLAGVGPLGAGEGDLRALARPALRSYAQRDGLPHHTVHQISRDAKGRLWAATQGGVAVFSGRRWTPLPLPPEATTAYVRSVVEDHQGTLWVGTHEDGVWQWRQGQWTGLGSAAGLPDPRVNQLCEAPEPGGGWRVWAATAAGPARWDEDHWTPCLAGLETPWAWRLVSAPDLQGNRVLWACTRGGLARWVEDRWILEPAFRGLEVNDLLALPGEEGQALWVSCFGKGLARWTRQGPAFLGRPQGLPLAFPVSLAATRDAGGRPVLWVGTYNDGLAYLREGRWFLLTTTHGLRSLGVYTLLPDPAGRPALWMGMQGGGVASLSTEGWMSLQFRSSGFPGVGVTCFQETREEEGLRLWIGTQRGLVWLDGSRWRTEDVRQGLPGSEIRALAAMEGTPSPRLVAATDKGLAERVGGRWRALPSPPGEVRLLLSSRGGTGLWVATSAGLFHRSGDGWVAAEGWEGPPPDALALAESQDPEGGHSLWVGTRGNGLWRSQKGRWSRFDPMPRYPRNWITSLRVGKGPEGRPRLWVGTRGQGLARLDLGTPGAPWKVYDARGPVPLPNTVILGIEEDRLGRLYLGASGGIERLSFGPDGSTLHRVETFGPADGLPTSIANPGATLLDHQGRVWFGLPEGPAFLDPSEAPVHRPLPAPVLDRIAVEGVEADPVQGLRFEHWKKRYAFEFFVPSYFREEDLRFRTQLLGLERDPGPWRYENVRDYSGLKPGPYELRVWVRNHEGQVSPPLRYAFSIRPSPWAHPLALAAYVLGAGGALLFVIRLRTRLLLKRNLWLQAKVDEATEELRESHRELQLLTEQLYRLNEEKSLFLGMAAHDLRNPLNGIMLKAELLGLSEDSKSHLVARDICDAVVSIVRMLDRLLDLEAIESGHHPLRLEAVQASRVLEQAFARHQARARAKGIQLLEEAPEEDLRVRADLETLMEALDNLLTNAVKFSRPGCRVWMGYGRREGRGCLWVRDEGPGFGPEDKARAFGRFAKLSARPTGGESSTGLGLAIVKRLVEDMGGRIRLDSELGQGAAFTLLLPLAEEGDPSGPG